MAKAAAPSATAAVTAAAETTTTTTPNKSPGFAVVLALAGMGAALWMWKGRSG